MTSWRRLACCRLLRGLSSLALPMALLVCVFALELAACARYPELPSRNGTLAGLCLFCAITAGRSIGVWAGLVCCRKSPIGVLVLVIAQAAVGSAAVVAADTRAWSAIARLCKEVSAAGLTVLSAALVVALLAASYAMMRHVTTSRTRRKCMPPG